MALKILSGNQEMKILLSKELDYLKKRNHQKFN